MLVEFSVENFGPFADKVTLSMVASSDKTRREDIIQSAQGTDFDLLPCVAIYGPNASGKTHLLNAMQEMCNLIFKSSDRNQPNKKLGGNPFRLSSRWQNKPTTFAITFLLEGVRYEYGFSYNDESIISEWLYSYPKKRIRTLFERETDLKTQKVTVDFNKTHWKGEKKAYENITSYNTLVLSIASQLNNEAAKKITDWLYLFYKPNSLMFYKRIYLMYLYAKLSHENKEYKKAALDFLQQADNSIKDLIITRKKLTDDSNASIASDSLIQLPTEIGGDNYSYKVHTIHKSSDDSEDSEGKLFDFSEESDGTKMMFSYSARLLSSLTDGCIVTIDEIDRSLHSMLSRWLIKKYLNKESNPNGAQLIFTTHDLTLMDLDLLRRDQIYFFEKQETGASNLYSLWDYKPRKGEKVLNGYLDGRYGAIPFIEDCD